MELMREGQAKQIEHPLSLLERVGAMIKSGNRDLPVVPSCRTATHSATVSLKYGIKRGPSLLLIPNIRQNVGVTLDTHEREAKAANAEETSERLLIEVRIRGMVSLRDDSSPGQSVRPMDFNARNADDAMEPSALDTRRFRIATIILTIVGTIS
jgi:hypothetical protein